MNVDGGVQSCRPTLRKGMIVGMGNSMLDLIGHVDKEVLEKYNVIANNGYLASEEHMPLFRELIEMYNANYVVGGSVQNSLRVTQWVLGEPHVCIIFGGVGCDEQGRTLVDKASADGVDTEYQYIEDTPTGICAVLLTNDGTERTLVANLSAANCFTIEHLFKPENQERLQGADIIYVSGFFLTVNVEAILHAAKCACNRNTWFVMNLSASFLAEQYMDKWCKVMPYVDVLFGNDTEARTFAKEHKFDELSDVHKIALELSHLPKIRSSQERIVIITQGHDPVIVAKDGVTKEYPVIQLSPDKVVDTTGAGDAFVGGFLAQLVQTAPLEECISCGIWCAAQMVQQQGCSLEGLIRYTPYNQESVIPVNQILIQEINYTEDTDGEIHYTEDIDSEIHYTEDTNSEIHFIEDNTNDEIHYTEDSDGEIHYAEDSDNEIYYLEDTEEIPDTDDSDSEIFYIGPEGEFMFILP